MADGRARARRSRRGAIEALATRARRRRPAYVARISRDLDALPALSHASSEAGPIEGSSTARASCACSDVAAWKWEDAQELIAIDLLAPLRLQDLVVRGMVERGAASIVNIASMAGRVPLRGCAYYGASKAGLAMASEIARADLAGRGVQVAHRVSGPGEVRARGGRARRLRRRRHVRQASRRPAIPTSSRAGSCARSTDDEPRVIYPRLYGVGWTAPNLSRWIALSLRSAAGR